MNVSCKFVLLYDGVISSAKVGSLRHGHEHCNNDRWFVVSLANSYGNFNISNQRILLIKVDQITTWFAWFKCIFTFFMSVSVLNNPIHLLRTLECLMFKIRKSLTIAGWSSTFSLSLLNAQIYTWDVPRGTVNWRGFRENKNHSTPDMECQYFGNAHYQSRWTVSYLAEQRRGVVATITGITHDLVPSHRGLFFFAQDIRAHVY